MSRIGKKIIEIPEKTEVTVGANSVSVKGPLGSLEMKYDPQIQIKIEDKKITLNPKKENKDLLAKWGTYSSIISNMIKGVNSEYKKTLIIEGVGYRAEVKGQNLVLNIGLSHQVPMKIPEGIKVSVEGDKILISGINKELVGQFSSDVRSMKKPEPYKGKGIRYSDEIIRRKEGKKTA
ncbi:MAG TPA: 50S ribosomal protein L6 [Candidatus Paceibacterota bacterium]|nr:50S ribosomal protein L6 [Candidatus Paceibacterota bacterium]HMP19184.1 50S ribosomal protein L6 [Candidatus Paceibacterota bacterium]HMP85285.1 50S ribosomal protein L6 [Candidatus Paceibacterota bacterium]